MTDEYVYEVTLQEGNRTVTWNPDTKANWWPKLVIKQCILGKEASTELNKIKVETRTIRGTIAVLEVGKTHRCRLDLEFFDSPVTFTLIEGNGPVHIHGMNMRGSFAEQFDEIFLKQVDVAKEPSSSTPEEPTNRPKISYPGTSGTTAKPWTVSTEEAAVISDERLKIFKQGVCRAFGRARDGSMSVRRLTKYIDRKSGTKAFSEGEVKAAIARMSVDNLIMEHDGTVFLI